MSAELMQGLALLQRGRLAEAQQVLSAILQRNSDDFDALHLLGVIALQAQETRKGVALISKAVAINPNMAEAHSNLGRGLRAMGRLEDALASYDRALALRPDLAEVHNNRGATLQALGRPTDALASYERAIALMPGFVAAHNNRGNALRELKRHETALASYDKAIALTPDLAPAHYNRGGVLRDLGRLDEALASYDQAIALKPAYAEAYCNRGAALQGLGRPMDALASYDKAIALRPDYAEAHNNRGGVLRDLERPAEALASYDWAIALNPDYADALSNRGVALQAVEQPEEALASFARAIALEPDHVDAHRNRGYCLLSLGRLEQGWRDHEWRRNRAIAADARDYPQPLWSGAQDLAGKTLFLYWEQGLGDTMQFCRYARLAAARGARVVLSVQDPLRRLLDGLGPAIEVIGARDQPVDFDLHAPLLSMPLAFGTTLDTVPAETPYLRAERDRVDAWKHNIGNGGFRIGVCWQGKKARVDLGRSYPLGELRGLAALPGVRLISLQKNDGIEQLNDLPAGMQVETLGPEFDAGPHAFLDTAAVMANLDLVVTSDTAVAHLAGALGRRAWVALQRVPDWRWMFEGDSSPWYPTLRLFRQRARGDWKSVFEAMAAELAKR